MENAQAPRSSPNDYFPLSLGLWLLPQLLILWLGLEHVPLWLNVPLRMDDLVLPELLCVQVITAVMVFPVVLRDWESTAAAILVAWPLTALAAFASARPLAQWISAAAYLSLLLGALAAWNRALRNSPARLAASGIATAATLGGVLMLYLRAESSNRAADALFGDAAVYNPIMGILRQSQSPASWSLWLLPLALLAAGLVLNRARRRSEPNL